MHFALSPTCSRIDDATGTILITKNLTIAGPGAGVLAVSGDNTVGLFYVYSGVTASISGLTLEDASEASGGAIDNNGTLTVSNSTVSGNQASANGGGIYNTGSLTISNSNLSANGTGGDGGAIYSGGSGSLTIANSIVSDNSAAGYAGGIDNESGSLAVSNDTISGNTSPYGAGITNAGASALVTGSTFSGKSTPSPYGFGGGIYTYGTMMTISNSTFVANATAEEGGGVYADGGSTSISNSTFVSNSAASSEGGGVWGSTASVLATILASNSGRDCAGGVVDKGL